MDVSNLPSTIQREDGQQAKGCGQRQQTTKPLEAAAALQSPGKDSTFDQVYPTVPSLPTSHSNKLLQPKAAAPGSASTAPRQSSRKRKHSTKQPEAEAALHSSGGDSTFDQVYRTFPSVPTSHSTKLREAKAALGVKSPSAMSRGDFTFLAHIATFPVASLAALSISCPHRHFPFRLTVLDVLFPTGFTWSLM